MKQPEAGWCETQLREVFLTTAHAELPLPGIFQN